jgi:hypothetical protein
MILRRKSLGVEQALLCQAVAVAAAVVIHLILGDDAVADSGYVNEIGDSYVGCHI